jgi:hypothetical protein
MPGGLHGPGVVAIYLGDQQFLAASLNASDLAFEGDAGAARLSAAGAGQLSPHRRSNWSSSRAAGSFEDRAEHDEPDVARALSRAAGVNGSADAAE